jgi:predicted RNA-binding Zn-ribbon protein involved in translation (DUF1610 family)
MRPPRDTQQIGTGSPSMIIDGRTCIACGYSLQGLWTDGVCPECGRPIMTRRKRIPRYSDNLINAPMGWLLVFSFGSTLLALSGIALIASLVVLAITQLWQAAFAALISGSAWSIATFMTTRPRPVTKATTTPPHLEWVALRWISRLTQVCWFLMGVGLFALARFVPAGGAGGASHVLSVATVALGCIAGLGIIPLCVILSNLAFWAEDAALGQHLRGCAWTVGVSGALSLLSLLHVSSAVASLGGPLVVLVAAMVQALVYFPILYMLFCLWLLHSMARWALRNHITAEAKDQRLRDKAALAALDPAAPTSKPIEPGPIPLAKDSIVR